MAVVIVAIDPPAIIEQVRYRRRYARRHKVEHGVAPFEQNVIVELPPAVAYTIKSNPFQDRWDAMGGKKGDRLR